MKNIISTPILRRLALAALAALLAVLLVRRLQLSHDEILPHRCSGGSITHEEVDMWCGRIDAALEAWQDRDEAMWDEAIRKAGAHE